MQLPAKQTFSQYFAAFLKTKLYFKHFEKKYHDNFCILEFTDSENVVR